MASPNGASELASSALLEAADRYSQPVPASSQEPTSISLELERCDDYADVVPQSGWLENDKNSSYFRDQRHEAWFEGDAFLHKKPPHISDMQPFNRDLRSYIHGLRKDVWKRRQAAERIRTAKFANQDSSKKGFPYTRASQDADAPKKQKAKANPKNYRVFTDSQNRSLKEKLLSARPLMKEGVHNAMRNEQSTEHAITELVEGLETEDGEFRLMPHQREAVGRWRHNIKEHHAVLLADDTGLGKTAVTLAVMLLDLKEDPDRKFLIVVPQGLRDSWLEEFRRAPSLRVKSFESRMTAEELHDCNVILASSSTIRDLHVTLWNSYMHFHARREGFDEEVERLLREKKSAGKASKKMPNTADETPQLVETRASFPLLDMQFHQVIIDEAHHIKNPNTHLARMMRLFKAKGRAAITATPVQNGLHDFGALLKYLRFSPFCELDIFRACFTRKRKVKGSGAARTNDQMLACIRSAITIRRLKDRNFDGQRMAGMPDCIDREFHIELGRNAQKLQDQIGTKEMWDFRAAKRLQDQGTQYGGDKNILQRVMEARLNAWHPELVTAKYNEQGDEDSKNADAHHPDSRDMIAAVTATKKSKTPKNLSSRQKDAAENDTENDDKPSAARGSRRRKEFMNKMRENGRWKSDYVLAIHDMIRDRLSQVEEEAAELETTQEKRAHRTNNKILVFCESLAMLDLIQIAGEQCALEVGKGKKKKVFPMPFRVSRLDGTCTREERKQARLEFEEIDEDGNPKDFSKRDVYPSENQVMLITTGAGSAGITLIKASDVVLVGPNWNPCTDDQCCGRCVRKGRIGPVTIRRLFCPASIEARIKVLQQWKRDTINSIMDDKLVYGIRLRLSKIKDKEFLRVVSSFFFLVVDSY